jgi:hypothetical protein
MPARKHESSFRSRPAQPVLRTNEILWQSEVILEHCLELLSGAIRRRPVSTVAEVARSKSIRKRSETPQVRSVTSPEEHQRDRAA